MMPCTRALVIREAAGVCIPRRLQSPANRLLPVSAPQPSPRGRAERVSIHAERSSFSSDQSQTALQYQLERSAPQQAQPDTTQNQPDLKSYEQDLKHRQQSAREWVTPWLTTKARARSMDTLAALRETSTAGLTSEQEDTALKRLLGQSWQVAAAHPVAFDSDEEADSVDEEISAEHADKSAPGLSWEDGPVFQAVSESSSQTIA